MKLLGAIGVERQADEPAAVLGHEVDGVGRRHLRWYDEVAFVLALLGIDENEHAPVAGVFDDLLDRRERRVIACLAHNIHVLPILFRCGAACREATRRDPLDVAREQIHLKVYQIAWLAGSPRRVGQGVGDNVHAEARAVYLVYRE
jgi:hypothetical protein